MHQCIKWWIADACVFYPVRAQFFLLTAVFELPVVPQSCRRTVELSWSRRRNSAARARPWSARVTVVTPPCTSAGIATPACPWWTLVLLWRYRTVFVSLLIVFFLPTHHISVFPLKPCSCGVFCFCPVCPGPRLHGQRTIDSMSFVLLYSCLCFCLSSIPPSLPLPPIYHLSVCPFPRPYVHADITRGH